MGAAAADQPRPPAPGVPVAANDAYLLGGRRTGPDANASLLFNAGPWTLDLADTIANFTNGTREDAQP